MGSIPVGSTKKGLNVSFGPFFCEKLLRFCVSIRDKAGVAFFDGFFVFLFVIHQLQDFCYK